VARRLRERRQTLAAAESCTGGLLAEKLTRLAGSSDYFLQGAVTYSNESKVRLLGVKRSTLKRRGAVSAECAREMARGCRTRSGADWAVSVTGIAGPGGAVPGKPVGTVFFGLAGPRGVSVKKRWFAGERAAVRERSAQFALDWLRKELA
jgi:PncC family amidohydrolase